jgi:RNA polymerase sigma-70 factor, ECF subfamily
MVAVLRLQLPDLPDEELVRLSVAGDQSAFSQLFRRHGRYVAGIVFRLLGTDSDVDDVVQLTFVEALRNLSKLEVVESFRGWLYRLSVRQVHRHLKRRWRLERLRSALSLVTFGTTEPRRLPEVIDVYAALASAAPEDRTAWLLHHVQEESLSDTARLCEVSLATIKRRIARAEKHVLRRFGDETEQN